MKITPAQVASDYILKQTAIYQNGTPEKTGKTVKVNKLARSREEINARILKVTMAIRNNYPELAQHLDEVPVLLNNKVQTAVSLAQLSAYCDTLNSLLDSYVLSVAHRIKTTNL